ncbi:hypothetical protein GUJ93_ZPchr0005g14617 [Zizania palustris]|uniref:Uncharacterized protein n=1 Tax=Zizania palustris TaxID=103762 RepID=A0A8J5S541_ZIZPA|nr:hypothetical protein GUJ93_ZPchr0005g14617 [Zizania palustris]
MLLPTIGTNNADADANPTTTHAFLGHLLDSVKRALSGVHLGRSSSTATPSPTQTLSPQRSSLTPSLVLLLVKALSLIDVTAEDNLFLDLASPPLLHRDPTTEDKYLMFVSFY